MVNTKEVPMYKMANYKNTTKAVIHSKILSDKMDVL